MSFKYDTYNSESHIGELPVRVLQYNYLDSFITITPDFIEAFEGEIFNNLSGTLAYKVDKEKITCAAKIREYKSEQKIFIYERYNQFLWNICYSSIVTCEEVVNKKCKKNKFIDEAAELFQYSMDLLSKYRDWDDYSLPNPEKYNENRKNYIEACNNVFIEAMVFILLHEFAHQFYGHNDDDYCTSDTNKLKKMELYADDYAYDKMSTRFGTNLQTTSQMGIAIALASLILLDESLKGGPEHPDPDYRLKRIIEKMNLDQRDGIWFIASLPFILWSYYYKVDIGMPLPGQDAKIFFYTLLEKIKSLKYFRSG